MCIDSDDPEHKCPMPESDTCPICMEAITEVTGFVRTPCGHIFGTDCFIAYIVTHNNIHGSAGHPSCPICRQDLTLPHSTPEDQDYPDYVVLPQYTGECDYVCGHHFTYSMLLRISTLSPGEDIRCRDDKGDMDYYCQRVIYKNTRPVTESETSPEDRIRMFAQSYNVLRIMSGLGGLAYSN
jgi:hypothetical protein